MSKLLTPQQLSELPDLYSTENVKDPICHFKLFTPDSNWSWYIMEVDKESLLCFGYVIGHESELGYFTLQELEEVQGSLGLPIELDIHYTPTLLSKVKGETL